jgi:DNA-binding NarL/FixJ family response regulator
MRRLRVLVVDDHEAVLKSVHLWVARTERFEVVATTDDPHGVVGLYEGVRPDVVLCDVFMPGLDGFATLRLLHAAHPDAAAVLFSALAEPTVVEHAAALGIPFLEKSASSSELTEALAMAHHASVRSRLRSVD